MEAGAILGDDAKIQLDLIDENGQFLYQKTLNYDGDAGARVYFSQQVPFQIGGVAELARLTVSTHDAFGRLQSLRAVDLILIQMGEIRQLRGRRNANPISSASQRPIRRSPEGCCIWWGWLTR